MAAPSKASPAPVKASPPPPRASEPPGAGLMLGYRLAKLAATAVGLPATLLCVMAGVGALTDNGYARVGVALVVAFGVPLFLADRLLPDDPARAKGVVTEVCTVFWLVVPFAMAALGNAVTRPLLAREGDRLAEGDYPDLARATYFLAGLTPVPVTPAPEPPAPAGSLAAGTSTGPAASTSASASASATASASASASGAPATTGSAAPAADAGATPHPAASSQGAAGKGDRTPADLFKELSPSVVTVFVKSGRGEGSGTGFLIDAEGTLVTNHHVVEEAQHVRIKFENGVYYEGIDLLADDATADLALLRVDLASPADGGAAPADAKPLVLGDSDAVVVGERAIAIGNPLGLEHTLTDGLVSSRRLYQNKAWIQMSVPISPGNSGGPLFNLRGEVIGITTATVLAFGVAQNLNLAVPVNELKKLLRPAYPGRRKVGDQSAPSRW